MYDLPRQILECLKTPPKDADGFANTIEPDLTASVGAVLCGSALFAPL